MKAICISASNIAGSHDKSVSLNLSEKVKRALALKEIGCEIVDLREYALSPCMGCGKCFDDKRCYLDKEFNSIYDKMTQAACIFFVSPHYAPIPAKLCMLLEKMEQITFLHWWKDNAYKAELYNIPAGIISHGGGLDWALPSYKAMVNDTIANALDTIQCRLIPYDDEWNTGISIPVCRVEASEGIFPIQRYEWPEINEKIQAYVERVVQAI